MGRGHNSAPSQRALCCVQHGCCSVPDGRPPDSGSDTATVPAGNGLPCPLRIWALFSPASHLPMTITRLKQVFPVPAASHTALPASAQQTISSLLSLFSSSGVYCFMSRFPFSQMPLLYCKSMIYATFCQNLLRQNDC